MNTEEFFSAATQIKDLVAFIVPAAVSAFAFLYVRARAGSARFFHDRLWRLLGGKKDYHSQILQGESDKLSDHEKFIYSTGIRFKSQRKITEALVWMQERNIGLEEVVRVRSYFNSNKISFEKPWLAGYGALHWGAIFFFVVATVVFLLSSLPAALLTIKKTETVIWASDSIVTAWDGYSWRVHPEDCVSGELSKLALDAHDEKVICDIFSKKENSDYLASSMLTQKIFGGMFWVLFGLFAFMAARALLIARQADELFKRAALHPVLQQQLPF